LRCIIFYDIDFEDFDSVIACDKRRREQGESISSVLPPHMMAMSDGTLTGFSILDVEDEEQMAKYIIQYGKAGKKNMQAYPIWETSKSFKIWDEDKKRPT
jgi:hypothetical protein